MENKEIIIDLSSEYKVKIEKVENFRSSIFLEIYESAKQNVLSILSHSKSNETPYDSYNNIIAFTGERGKGKSSAMISFLNALKSVGGNVKKDNFLREFYDNEKDFPKYSFIDLDVIDPSLFRGNETLFEIVLAKMFSKFKKEIELSNSNKTINDEDRRQLVKHFQNVFENLKYTNGNYKDELYRQEALDALIKLSASSNLRESFKQLVEKYLSVMNGNSKTESVLVISIDDFDLKIEGVYEMLEDVRQFLISENVIVLIACKMEQMQQAVEMTIQRHFYNPLNLKPSYFNTFEINPLFELKETEIKNKSSKYLEKLFPISRQNKLPNTENIKLDEILQNTISKNNDLKILETIYKKKGIFYTADKYLNHIIYDDTLRSLFNLFNSIESEDPGQFVKYCEIRFSDFLKPENLSILINCDYVLLNTYILKILADEFYSEIENYLRIELERLYTSSKYEIIQNADVTTFLYVILKSLNITTSDYKKIKAISSIYNLRNSIAERTNLNLLKNKSVSGFVTPRFINKKYRIPQNNFNRKDRDYFKVNQQIKIDLYQDNELLVISSFVQNLGNNDNDYMTAEENIYLNRSFRRGAPFQNFYFSIYTFINAPKNISNLYNRFKAKASEELKDYQKKWDDSIYSTLFNSNDFVIEFYENLVEAYRNLSKASEIKSEASEDLYSNLYILFTRGIEQVFKKLNEKYEYLKIDFDDFLNVNIVLKIFIEQKDNKNIKEFINKAFENYEYVRSLSGINSLDDIQNVGNLEPLRKIIVYLQNNERINKKPLQDLINEIDEQDSDLKEFILQKNFFDQLFVTNQNKRIQARTDLVKQFERLIENGQSQE